MYVVVPSDWTQSHAVGAVVSAYGVFDAQPLPQPVSCAVLRVNPTTKVVFAVSFSLLLTMLRRSSEGRTVVARRRVSTICIVRISFGNILMSRGTRLCRVAAGDRVPSFVGRGRLFRASAVTSELINVVPAFARQRTRAILPLASLLEGQRGVVGGEGQAIALDVEQAQVHLFEVLVFGASPFLFLEEGREYRRKEEQVVERGGAVGKQGQRRLGSLEEVDQRSVGRGAGRHRESYGGERRGRAVVGRAETAWCQQRGLLTRCPGRGSLPQECEWWW